MEAAFWHERWDNDQIRFNQAEANGLLVANWPDLAIAEGATVFVPLCGKSIDMVWLASRGHRVVGIELSPRAVADFFTEQGISADVRQEGALTVHTGGPYELWCGDLFDLTAAPLAAATAVYDRASLVALPPDLRQSYASHLGAVLPETVTIFLISFEYDASEMDGPPFSVSGEEIAALFGDAFDIEPIFTREGLEPNGDLRQRGLTKLNETLTVLRR